MTDLPGRAVEAVALSVLEARVKARRVIVNNELAAELSPGDRKTARVGDGVKVGGVTYTEGRVSARVVDEAGLLAWVKANHPSEVVETVRGSFTSMLLSNAKRDGAAVTGDGEVVPGIVVDKGDPYITTTKPTAEQLPALLDAVRANGLLALESGEQ